MPRILIGLGSNVDPVNHLKAAVTMLREQWPQTRFSSIYESAPQHHTDQSDFLNAVALLEHDAPVSSIASFLHEVEKKRGKDVAFRFGPRTLDLDLLLYGDEILPDPATWERAAAALDATYSLLLPHPRMHERRFVLEPMLELIDPTETHPALKKPWKEFLAATADQDVRKTPLQL